MSVKLLESNKLVYLSDSDISNNEPESSLSIFINIIF